MIQGSQITARLKMARERSDRPGEWWLHDLRDFRKLRIFIEKPFSYLKKMTSECKDLCSFHVNCISDSPFNIHLMPQVLKKRFTQQHLQSQPDDTHTHTDTQKYRSQTAHCALWPSMGRVGLGSSGNQEDRPSPLSHNEGLITGPASLKSHGSRLPVSVLCSPNILIALLFSLCFYCASLPNSPQPFHT